MAFQYFRRSTSFFLHTGENRDELEVVMEHNCKLLVTRLSTGKYKEVSRGKKMKNPDLYPILLVIHELGLKL